MIAKVLVFACAAFGLAAASCFEVVAPQQCSSSCSAPQVITIPVQTESAPSCSVSVPCAQEQAPVVLASCSVPEINSCGSLSGLQATNGPETSSLSVMQAPDVTLPAVEGPIITLSSQPIPAPRVLSQRCICTKTILRPQVYQRTVTVPKIQRYLKRTVTPVIENVAYKSTPISQSSSSGSSAVVVSSNSGSSSSCAPVVISSGSGCCESQTKYVVSSGSSCPRMC